jgi:hypothetical protein
MLHSFHQKIGKAPRLLLFVFTDWPNVSQISILNLDKLSFEILSSCVVLCHECIKQTSHITPLYKEILRKKMKSRPSSIDMFDWSPHKSTQADDEAVVMKKNWALIGNIDSASSSSSYDDVQRPELTPNQPSRRHRCISEGSDFSNTSRDSHEYDEQSIFDLKPKSMDSSYHSQSSEPVDEELSYLSQASNQSRPKRRRDDSCRDLSHHFDEEAKLSCSEDKSFMSRKRRRVAGRNRALCAADFDDIFSQMGC